MTSWWLVALVSVATWEAARRLLRRWRLSAKRRVAAVAATSECKLPALDVGDDARFVTFNRPDPVDGSLARALFRGLSATALRGARNLPMRLHSECFTGDVLGSRCCDCGQQLARFKRVMRDDPRAVLVYVQGHEGRGNGLAKKIAAYALGDAEPQTDHTDRLLRVGGTPDSREYDHAFRSVREHFGIASVVLHTNCPAKLAACRRVFGSHAVTQATMTADDVVYCRQYLVEKVETRNHAPALVPPA